MRRGLRGRAYPVDKSAGLEAKKGRCDVEIAIVGELKRGGKKKRGDGRGEERVLKYEGCRDYKNEGNREENYGKRKYKRYRT
jgi:hypothetical protein